MVSTLLPQFVNRMLSNAGISMALEVNVEVPRARFESLRCFKVCGHKISPPEGTIPGRGGYEYVFSSALVMFVVP